MEDLLISVLEQLGYPVKRQGSFNDLSASMLGTSAKI